MSLLLVGVLAPVFLHAQKASALSWTVDSVIDAADNNIGDGICDDGDGNCTLRAAIQEANSNAGADDIDFTIPGAGVHTIELLSELPPLTEEVHIDGASQPGVSCGDLMPDAIPATSNTPHNLLIEINGSALTYSSPESSVINFGVGASGSSLNGLVINNAGATADDNVIGLYIAGSNSDVSVTCNYFGSGADGTTSQSNFGGDICYNNGAGTDTVVSNNLIARGIYLNNITGSFSLTSNLIGTDEAGQANIDAANSVAASFNNSDNVSISGNLMAGALYALVVQDGAGYGVSNNQIGLGLNGSAVTNTYGMTIEASSNVQVNDNIVIGSEATGISVNDTAGSITGNDVYQNQGDGLYANTYSANQLEIYNNSLHNNANSGARLARYIRFHDNNISNNTGSGVIIDDGIGTTVFGSTIGLTANGEPAGNVGDGIRIIRNEQADGDADVIIGGTNSAERNVISANGKSGVVIYNDSCSKTVGSKIIGNYIGTKQNGEVAQNYGNAGSGIQVYETKDVDGCGGESVYNHQIGGDANGEQNVIAGNQGDGIQVYSVPWQDCDDGDGVYRCGGTDVFNIAIMPNSIFGNNGIGINLATDSDNDGIADQDTGPATKDLIKPAAYPAEQANHYVAYPKITNAVASSNKLTVTYDFDAKPADETLSIVGYRLDFYTNDTVDASGYGQGKTHLGSFVVDGSEKGASHTFTPVASLNQQLNITATATLLVEPSFDNNTARGASVTAKAEPQNILARIKSFFMPTALAAEISPANGSYVYGSTSEFSSYVTITNNSNSILADTGSNGMIVIISATLLFATGNLLISHRKRA